MRQTALDMSMLLLASDVSMSANRKSAHETLSRGNSTRMSVEVKKRLTGQSSTLAGNSRIMASKEYRMGAIRMGRVGTDSASSVDAAAMPAIARQLITAASCSHRVRAAIKKHAIKEVSP